MVYGRKTVYSNKWFVALVCDTGLGISCGDMRDIFTAYKQLSSGVSKTYQGTGLHLQLPRRSYEGHPSCRIDTWTVEIILCTHCPITPPRAYLSVKAVVAATAADENINEFENGKEEDNDDDSAESGADSGADSGPDSGADGGPDGGPDGGGPVGSRSIPMALPAGNCKQSGENDPTLHLLEPAIETSHSHSTADPQSPTLSHNYLPFFMIVDDSKVNLRLAKYKMELSMDGAVEVLLAVDGFDAIEKYQGLIDSGRQPLLQGVLMDYHMPRCSGIEAILEMRRLEQVHGCKPVYVVAFTADLSESSQRQLLEAGANEVMEKPTPDGELEAFCRRRCGQAN